MPTPVVVDPDLRHQLVKYARLDLSVAINIELRMPKIEWLVEGYRRWSMSSVPLIICTQRPPI